MTPSTSRPPLQALILLIWRLRLARFLLWLARASDRYSGPHMRIARWLVESAERAIFGRPPAP